MTDQAISVLGYIVLGAVVLAAICIVVAWVGSDRQEHDVNDDETQP